MKWQFFVVKFTFGQRMNPLFLLGVLMIVFSCQSNNTAKQAENSGSQNDTTSFHLTLPQTMNDMAARMKAIPFSGNNDRDFASLIMEYYDGAIDMARLQTSHGKQKDLKEFAQSIVIGLKQELLRLSDFLKNEPAEKSSSPEKFQQKMNAALSQMNVNNGFNEPDVDHLFILLMIIHHKAGVQMLRAELDYGSHQTVKIEARNILAKQEDELRWLQSWLSKN